MDFEWDSQKADINAKKHGVPMPPLEMSCKKALTDPTMNIEMIYCEALLWVANPIM